MLVIDLSGKGGDLVMLKYLFVDYEILGKKGVLRFSAKITRFQVKVVAAGQSLLKVYAL